MKTFTNIIQNIYKTTFIFSISFIFILKKWQIFSKKIIKKLHNYVPITQKHQKLLINIKNFILKKNDKNFPKKIIKNYRTTCPLQKFARMLSVNIEILNSLKLYLKNLITHTIRFLKLIWIWNDSKVWKKIKETNWNVS